MKTLNQSRETLSPWVGRWLLLVAAMIFTTLVVGGATRLTKSGLSITEWKPLMGTLPPLTDADWFEAFAKYQQSSQYQLMNQGMSLAEFKYIFWWEWGHRFLDRMIGAVFLIPFVYFVATKAIPRRLWPRLLLIFLAGALEGVVGWFMVASGLVDRVSVSQYFLAAHLTIATLIYAATLWTFFGLGNRHTRPSAVQNWLSVLIPAFIVMQIAAGGFVAGLDAGQGYNTWPLMDGALIPSGLGAMQPGWANLFENALTVQFDHRLLAYVIFGLVLWHAGASRSTSARLLLAAALLQIALGIDTLLMHVPIGLALMHQGGALLLLTAALWNVNVALRISSSPDSSQR